MVSLALGRRHTPRTVNHRCACDVIPSHVFEVVQWSRVLGDIQGLIARAVSTTALCSSCVITWPRVRCGCIESESIIYSCFMDEPSRPSTNFAAECN